MKRKLFLGSLLVLSGALLPANLAAQGAPRSESSAGDSAKTKNLQLMESYGRLPLSFEANDGQFDPQVKFLSRGVGRALLLTPAEAILVLSNSQGPNRGTSATADPMMPPRTSVLRMKLLGANRDAEVRGLEKLPGKSNYFIGNDPAKWRTGVAEYSRVRYSEIYPGVDLVYYGNQRELEYDFIIAPGADPQQIRLAMRGADKVSIDEDGNAVIHCNSGDIRLLRPHLYQEIRGLKREVAGRYAFKGHELRFAVGRYDHHEPLVIDPVLVYSTYLGGSGIDLAQGIVVDSSGNAIIAGYTGSVNFPLGGNSVQASSAGGTYDVFVSKLNATGSLLLYSTYLGGSGDDVAYGLAQDSSGNAYVSGETTSTNFPTTSAALQQQRTLGSTGNAFVTKLNATGNALLYSTYLGGNGFDVARSIAVDSSGNAYVAGLTTSTNFPGANASSIQATHGGGTYDAFAAKLNPAGSSLVYSTYLGGSGYDAAYGLAIDTSGNAFVTGETNSKTFPGVNAQSIQPVNGGSNAFVAELNAAGATLLYSTFLGGSARDFGLGIAADSAGNAYVTGGTQSANFPVTSGALQATYAGVEDAFVAKLNPGGTALVYSTYLGGSGADVGSGIAVDASGNAYVSGGTASTNFPGVSSNSIQSVYGGGASDAFFAELNPPGSALVYATYLGGSGAEGAQTITIDGSNNVYIAGYTASPNFPLGSSPVQSTFGGGTYDAFVAKLGTPGTAGSPTATTLTSSVNPSAFGQSVTFTATVTSSGGTPTGTVAFSDSAGPSLGSGQLTNGQATLVASSLLPGAHSITATYGGDPNFGISSSTPLTQTVGKASPTITLVSSVSSTTYGLAVTFTATITGAGGGGPIPGGSVTFQDGQTSLGTPVAISKGAASFTTTSLAVGSHSITAAYGGDANYNGSTSVPLVFSVGAPPQLYSQGTIQVGTGPIAAAINPVTHTMYVANQTSNDVTVIDTHTNAILAASIPVGKAPTAVAVNTVTNRIYVANRDSSNVTEIDGATYATTSVNVADVIGTIVLPLAPVALAVNEQSGQVYVGTSGCDLAVIDSANTASHIGSYLCGPIAALVSPLTGRAYVVESHDAAIEMYDPGTNLLFNNFTTNHPTAANQPQALAINAPTVYAADGTGLTGLVDVFNEATNANAQVPVGHNAYAIAVNPVDGEVYAASPSPAGGQAATVTAISGNVVDVGLSVGQTPISPVLPAPNKIGVDSTNNLIFVANEASNDVTVIDGASLAVLGAFPVGNFPTAVIVNPERCNAYVTNFGSGNVTVNQPSNNGPGVCLYPAALVFGPQAVGTTSAPKTIILTNIGKSTLSITSVAVSGDFNGTGTCVPISSVTATQIAPGGQCTIQVTSTPTAAGVRTGQVIITDNASRSPHAAALTGDGVSLTTTQLTVIPNPVVYGQALNLSAKVVASQGIPTGTLTFFLDGQRSLGTLLLASDGSASFNTNFPFLVPAGSQHTLTAVYHGDLNFAGSTSPAVQLVVNKASTTIASTFVSPVPSTSPQTLHAQVDVVGPGGGVPTGNVVFQEGAAVLGTGVLDIYGAAATTAYFGGGQHSISVSYQGDPNYLPSSSSQPLLVTVPISTATTLQSSSATVTFGTGVTFTATVTASLSAGGNIGGTIIFRDGPNVIGSFALSGATTTGMVTTPSFNFPVGQHSITAEYQDLAGGNFLGSKSRVVVLTVSPAGGGGGTPGCACSLTGAYVSPVTPVDPSSAILSPHGKYTVTATFDTSNQATGASLYITRNADQVVVLPQRNSAITTNFGFSPDDDRFVLHYLTGSIDNVELYDLTVQPARRLVLAQSPAGTTSTALSFSPSGRYFMFEFLYVNGGSTIARLQIYQIQNVASQLLIYDSGDFFFVSVPGSGEDSFGVVGQGFSPDNPETTFVYSYVAGPNVAGKIPTQWNLVSLVTPQKLPEKTITLTDISDTSEYSPCGDVIGLIRQLQAQATGAANVAEVDLIATATGLSLNPNGYQAATIQLLLNCTSNGQQVTDNSTGQPVVVTLAPNAGCSNTPKGQTVTVLPQDAGGSGLAPVTITFNNVTVPGATTLNVSSSGPPPPAGTQPGNPVKYFDVSTTATFSSATVCISYADLAFGSSNIIVLHNKNGTWDIPQPQTIDTVHQTICATVTSFSPFLVAEQISPPSVSASSTGLLISPNPASAGQVVTFTSGVSTGTGTGSGPAPTGSVTFLDGGTPIASPVNLPNSGPVTFTISTLAAGTHTITAQYSGDPNYSSSTSAAITLNVNLNSANIGLFVSPPGPVVVAGQFVTLTSGVSGTTGSGIPAPTGFVTFLDGSTPITSPVNLSSSGAAMLAISTLAAGTHTLTAQYNGDANYSSNTSAAVTLLINKSATSIGLFSSLNPSAAGQSVTFFAGVTGLGPTGTGAGAVPPPTGSITFLDNGVAMGPAVMVFSVTQSNPNPPSFSTSTLAAGTHTITAQYSGDNNYNSSTSPQLFQTVNKSPANINSLSNGNSANPSKVGQAVTFYSVVVGSAPSGVPAPTGSLTFLDNGVAMGPAVMVFSVTQSNPNPPSFSTSMLTAGTHTITAQYSGDNNYNSTTSPTFIQTVNKDQVSVDLGSNSPNPSAAGQAVTFISGVTQGPGTPAGVPAPTGSVTFIDNGVALGPAVIFSSPAPGSLNPPPVSFTTNALTVGAHTITAQYSGDANYLSSASLSFSLTITNPATTTGLSASPNPSMYGQPVTFNAVVSSSTGTPAGNVTFFDGSTSLGPGTLNSSGVATLTTSLLTAGTHSITASYPATGNFLASTSSAVTQTVNPAPLVVTVDNKSRQYAQPNPQLTGTISGLQNGDNITATYTTTATPASPVGTYPITDPLIDPNGRLPNYTVVVNNGTLTITAAPLTITANNLTKTYGQTVAFAGTEFTSSGLLNTDKVTGVTLASAGAAATATVAGSPYPVTPSAALGTGLGNYNISYVSGILTVTQAVLTITADNKTKILNAPLPSFTATYSGFVNSDGPASLTGLLNFATNATASSPVGTYAITPSGLSSTNYTIGYRSGTLTITYQPGGMCDGDFNHQILQPINADGTSVWKQGRTIPAKFRVCDANGVSIGTPGVVAGFNLVQIIAGTITTVDETVSSTTADTAFRWDPTGQQWIFNISTANLLANQTYVYAITLNDGSNIMFRYGLR